MDMLSRRFLYFFDLWCLFVYSHSFPLNNILFLKHPALHNFVAVENEVQSHNILQYLHYVQFCRLV